MPYKIGQTIGRILIYVDDQFSISVLIRTFFSPWKRDYSAVGYFMGVAVRIVYLPIAIIIYLIACIISIASFVFWLLLPLVTVFFIIATPFLNI
jgi:uncharacterized membrane protein YkgB